jgi:SNF2 family DNA or RNA helicase
LNYLSEVKWGGILADDMGLGKTVQALTFMQHFKNVTWKAAGYGRLSHHSYL